MIRTTIYLTENQYEQVHQLAEIDQVKAAEIIRFALEAYFQKREKDLKEHREEKQK